MLRLVAWLLLIMGVFCVIAQTSGARTWNDRKGRTLEAEFVGVKDGKVEVKRDNDGKTFQIPLVQLSEADQAFVKSQLSKVPAAEPLSNDKLVGMRAGEERDDNGLQMKLIWCPPGEFMMGSPKVEKDREEIENQVAVTLTQGFWLAKTEVTQSQWKAVMEMEPWKSKSFTEAGEKNAASYVNWNEATEYCKQLTEKEREAGRLPDEWEYALPTEAQWEYACRAGTTTRYYFGDDEADLDVHAWYATNAFDTGEKYPHEVGLKSANPWGLQDMYGNVREWCRDLYAEELPGGKDPIAPKWTTNRVYRGAGWGASASACRSASRERGLPFDRLPDLGFRIALVSVDSQ